MGLILSRHVTQWLVGFNQDVHQLHELLGLLGGQGLEEPLLGFEHARNNRLQNGEALFRGREQAHPSVVGRYASLDQTARLQTIYHAANGGGIKSDSASQAFLIQARLIANAMQR